MTPGTPVTILPTGWKGTVLRGRHEHPWWPTYRVGGAWYAPSQLDAEAPVVVLPRRKEPQ